MQKGFKTLTEFAQEIERAEMQKRDYLVPSASMGLFEKNKLDVPATGVFELNRLAEGQLANKLGIPKPFYDRMGDFPGLREHAVNELLNDYPGRRMVRTLDNKVRAFLSDSYKPMDNYPVLTGAMAALDASSFGNNLRIRSSNITDEKMYLQISFPTLTREVVPGDAVEYGITITNSETGCGSIDVSSMIWRLVCSNGMVSGSVLKKRHVGKRMAEFDNYDIFKNDTIKADVEAFRLKFRDVLAASMTESAFEESVLRLQGAAADRIERPDKVIENVTKHFELSEKDGSLVLANMAQENNFTRWGLANGITALAHKLDNADRQYEVEKLGNDIITLTPNQWEKLSA